MMTMDDYTQITWQDVRKGDVLMHENGGRLTVGGVGAGIYATGFSHSSTSWQALGFSPYRRKPEMPTAPTVSPVKRASRQGATDE